MDTLEIEDREIEKFLMSLIVREAIFSVIGYKNGRTIVQGKDLQKFYNKIFH